MCSGNFHTATTVPCTNTLLFLEAVGLQLYEDDPKSSISPGSTSGSHPVSSLMRENRCSASAKAAFDQYEAPASLRSLTEEIWSVEPPDVENTSSLYDFTSALLWWGWAELKGGDREYPLSVEVVVFEEFKCEAEFAWWGSSASSLPNEKPGFPLPKNNVKDYLPTATAQH